MAVTVQEFVNAVKHGAPPDGPYDITPEDKEAAMRILFPVPEPEAEEEDVTAARKAAERKARREEKKAEAEAAAE